MRREWDTTVPQQAAGSETGVRLKGMGPSALWVGLAGGPAAGGTSKAEARPRPMFRTIRVRKGDGDLLPVPSGSPSHFPSFSDGAELPIGGGAAIGEKRERNLANETMKQNSSPPPPRIQ